MVNLRWLVQIKKSTCVNFDYKKFTKKLYGLKQRNHLIQNKKIFD